jgi:predicted RND superfamily exporter protein
MEKLSNIVVKYRWTIIVTVGLLTAFFAYQLRTVRVDSNVINSLPENDSVVRLFKEVGERFGSNQMGMVILEAENVLEPEVLTHIEQISDTLSEIPGVFSVTSLTNMMTANVEGDNFEVDLLINDKNRPKNKAEAEVLKEKITSNEMVVGNIIAKDGTATNIIFSFEEGADAEQVAKQVMAKIESLKIPEKYYFAGASFITRYVAEVVSHDLITLIPISFLLIALILYLSFRSIRGIVLPLLTAGLAIVWAMGVFGILGLKLSMVSNNVPIIILAVGSAYAIHILNKVSHCIEKDTKKAVVKSLSLLLVPVSLTALTTVIGFLSFIFGAYLQMIRDFGLLAALGTFFAAVLALSFVPALLAVLPKSKNSEKLPGNNKSSLAQKTLKLLNESVTEHTKRVLIVWLLFFIISIVGITMLKRSVSVAGYFKKNHPVSKAEHIMNKKFGGSKPVFVVFKGNVQSPELLKFMMKTEDYMKKSPYISSTNSIADIVAKLNMAMGGEDKIPDDEGTVGQLWFLLDQQESISRLVTPELDQAIIIAKFMDVGHNDIKKLNAYMQSFFKENASDEYTVEMTGMPFVNTRLDESLLYSQIASLFIAIVLVIALVSLIFFSFSKGLFASVPIIATIGILYGIMGLTGIPLNIATVLVASISIGIGIDYSIHFISHYNHAIKRLESVPAAIEETILQSGNAILINFISVSAGFFVLVFSDLVPMLYFGLLIALSMLGSSMGALTLLPALMLIGYKNKNKKNHDK